MGDYSQLMKLNSIRIQNYRSIEDETLQIQEIDGGYTYTLIGVNESGKSSVLKAISLKEGTEKISLQDFHDNSKPILVSFNYSLTDNGKDSLLEKLREIKFPEELLERAVIKQAILKVYFEPTSMTFKKGLELDLGFEVVDDYVLKGTSIMKKDETSAPEDLNLKKYLEENLLNFFFDLSHHVVFWKSESKYLITDSINLDNFAKDPGNVSIPLRNCFELAGIPNISGQINKIKNNPSETKNLIDKLEDIVTDHIKQIWPGHPINIKFNIDGVSLTFLVEDEGVRYRTKTTSQRSDGFRQFISFLLTISAQHSNDQLSDSLLLLDEPETHLHPNGQENLRDELIKISKGSFNNIVIFATHSNYMIDKDHLERCYRVSKERNVITKVKSLNGQKSSYSEVNYIVFNVPTNDYHNELYGFIETVNKGKLEKLEKDKIWKNTKSGRDENVSLPTYIRHSIHHPENTSNQKVNLKELTKSIETLRGLKQELDQK